MLQKTGWVSFFDSLSISQGYSLKQKPSEISKQIVKQSEKHMEQVLC